MLMVGDIITGRVGSDDVELVYINDVGWAFIHVDDLKSKFTRSKDPYARTQTFDLKPGENRL